MKIQDQIRELIKDHQDKVADIAKVVFALDAQSQKIKDKHQGFDTVYALRVIRTETLILEAVAGVLVEGTAELEELL